RCGTGQSGLVPSSTTIFPCSFARSTSVPSWSFREKPGAGCPTVAVACATVAAPSTAAAKISPNRILLGLLSIEYNGNPHATTHPPGAGGRHHVVGRGAAWFLPGESLRPEGQLRAAAVGLAPRLLDVQRRIAGREPIHRLGRFLPVERHRHGPDLPVARHPAARRQRDRARR